MVLLVRCLHIEWNVGFCGWRKTGGPGEKPSEQGQERTTNSIHMWRKLHITMVLIVSVKSFEIPRWGRGWGGLSDWECNQAFPVNNKGNKSYQELRTHLLYKHSFYFMFPFHQTQNSFVIINQQRFVMMAAVLVKERNITNFLFARKTFHPKYIY